MSLDRRTTIKWMFAAAATVPSLQALAYAPEPHARDVAENQAGYGTDPNLTQEWRAGGPWPLTLGVAARLTTMALCDLIIPADDVSPAASSVGVVEFIDEWISAPYPQQRRGVGAAAQDPDRPRHRQPLVQRREGRAQVRHGLPVLRQVPRSHRRRLLHHARGNERHRLRGQCAAREVRRSTA